MIREVGSNQEFENAIIIISQILKKYDKELDDHNTSISQLKHFVLIQDRLNEETKERFSVIMQELKKIQFRLEFEMPQPNWED